MLMKMGSGLAIVFAEDPAGVPKGQPEAWDELCPIYDALPATDL